MKQPVYRNNPAETEQSTQDAPQGPSSNHYNGGNRGRRGAGKPGRGQQPAAAPQPYEQPDPAKRPEILRTFYQIWMVLLGLECIHQILNLVMSMLSRDYTANMLRDMGVDDNGGISDALLNASVIGAAIVNFLVIIGILVYTFFAVRKIYAGTQRAATHLRVLNFFAIYFMVRGIFTFLAEPASVLPIGFYAVDGCLRIAIGVAGVLLIWAGGKRETLDWLGVQLPERGQRKDSK